VEAAEIGLVLKAVPADELEREAEGLADRIALIDVDLLSAQKRIVNTAMELMGARTLQRMAAERDCIARQAPIVTEFYTMAKEKGLKAALEWRDARFADGRASPGRSR
jgi:enoyl-CoA hydratase